jgi:hypothetical protein
MPKFLSTRISVVSRGGSKGGGSAVDASGYIDREKRYSEYMRHDELLVFNCRNLLEINCRICWKILAVYTK